MKKMKVIDLLNKIANGEDVPEKIKHLGIDFSFQHNCNEYISDYGTCFIRNISSKSLNDEIEVIEDIPISKLYINNKLQYDLTPKEDKKIEKLDNNIAYYSGTYETRWNDSEMYIVDKINEIIDKINGEDNE